MKLKIDRAWFEIPPGQVLRPTTLFTDYFYLISPHHPKMELRSDECRIDVCTNIHYTDKDKTVWVGG
ncbi:MAG: hypothetical protein EHM33_11370 [Chloroflexi bacterium]|nr:MAG: hypothetical protein EHM33_11370 [Chloroflexota bacterium]